jgi:hypothetical protein
MSTTMMAITINSSIRVKPRLFRRVGIVLDYSLLSTKTLAGLQAWRK